MMLSSAFIGVLLPLAVLANPVAENDNDARSVVRPCTVKVTTDGVRYRTCAKTSCRAVGQYDKGKKLKISCVTSGTKVGGDTTWIKTSSGYYVSGHYLTSINACGAQYIC